MKNIEDRLKEIEDRLNELEKKEEYIIVQECIPKIKRDIAYRGDVSTTNPGQEYIVYMKDILEIKPYYDLWFYTLTAKPKKVHQGYDLKFAKVGISNEVKTIWIKDVPDKIKHLLKEDESN